MNSLYILDRVRVDEGSKIEGAIFLTYSIDCKSILATLLKMFTSDNETDNSKKNTRRALVGRFKYLLEHGMGNNMQGVDAYNDLKSHVAFVCNDGCDKSIASPIYWYTKHLTYYYKTEYSFHPKLYIIKYSKESDGNKEFYFRIMVGSMNLVDSHNVDMMMVKDIRAYDSNSDKSDRVQCDMLNELLDYSNNSNNCCNISNRSDELKIVLENLNLHGLWFNKEDIPEFLVFSGNNKPMDEQPISKVISPFLTMSADFALNKNLEIYTMESELNKKGWVSVEKNGLCVADNKECRKFFVYKADEKELQFNHIKMYVIGDGKQESIYIGSTNFTDAAFNKNKEILVKLEIPNNKLGEFKKEILLGYIEKTFEKTNNGETDEEDKIQNLIKKISVKLSLKMKQTIEKNDNMFLSKIVYCDVDKEDINNIICKEEFSNYSEIQIKITPFLMKNMKDKSIIVGAITEKGIHLEISPNGIEVPDRRLLDERFVFTYWCDDKKVVDKEFVYSIKTETNTNTLEEQEDKISSKYMLTFLQTFLAENKTNDVMLTKEIDGLMKGNTISLSNYCSKVAIPELEKMLEKWLKDDNYKPDGQKIEEIYELISEDSKDKLTETEMKNFGVTLIEKKMIKNLYEQWSKLKSELDNNIKM